MSFTLTLYKVSKVKTVYYKIICKLWQFYDQYFNYHLMEIATKYISLKDIYTITSTSVTYTNTSKIERLWYVVSLQLLV